MRSGPVHDRRGCAQRLHAAGWRWLLLPAWLVYAPLTRLRNAAFDSGLRAANRLPIPVISVGNLTVGGTGKTPIVQWLVDCARKDARKPVVLSRGYRAAIGGNDEARMLDAEVLCDPDRHRAGMAAAARGFTCAILDDGFQHRQLHRDLDIVLIDASRPWGLGMILPVGLLRESRNALKRADLIVITHSDEIDEGASAALQQELARFAKPVLRAMHQPTALALLAGGAEQPPEALVGKPVVLASGIGNPVAFERGAERLGWDVRASLRFPDHHHFATSDWNDMVRLADEHKATLVVTAKDAVKLAAIAGDSARRCLVLRMRIDFADNDAATFAERVRAALNGAPRKLA